MSPSILLLTGFGLGHLRPGPGTWGSLPPVALALALTWLLGHDQSHWSAGQLVIINIVLASMAVFFTVVCLTCGGSAETCFACKDPQQVVADELAGQSIALLLLPWAAGNGRSDWGWNLLLAGIAFGSFRLMDILKPPPARRLQTCRSGLGIVIDDLIAGVYALLLTHAVVWLLGAF